MKDFIKIRLREDLEYYHVGDASPESSEYEMGLDENVDKFGALENDIRLVMSKHQNNFAEYEGDSYSIIDAVNRVMDEMFQRV